jgi:hypothetical protein
MALMNNFDHYSWCGTRAWEMIHSEAVKVIETNATNSLLKTSDYNC